MAQCSFLRDRCLLFFSLLGGLILGITILPLLNMTIQELSDIPHLLQVASDSKVIDSIILTMGAGANAIIILMIFGIPLAYVLARAEFMGKKFVETIVDIPLMLPHTVAGILVYILFMKRGLVGGPLYNIGFSFEDAYPGIVVAMLFVSSPYFINSAREGFEKVPLHLENVARTLGATRFSAFLHVTLPLSARHIYNGAIFSWGRAIGEFAAIIMIAYYPMVISTLLYYRFSTGGLKESSSIAFILILSCFTVFLILRYLSRFIGRYDDRV